MRPRTVKSSVVCAEEGVLCRENLFRPDHCYRAAIADDSNAIFLISAHEDSQLAGDGRLGKETQLVSMASKAVAGMVGR